GDSTLIGCTDRQAGLENSNKGLLFSEKKNSTETIFVKKNFPFIRKIYILAEKSKLESVHHLDNI
ncbi:MAG: hypothetical protein AMJ90_08740, partial [candidate division Zixibacteria bacterium SM23_73_2]